MKDNLFASHTSFQRKTHINIDSLKATVKFIQTINNEPKKLTPKELVAAIKAISQKHHCDLFYIFGSYCSKKMGPLSDIDCAILPSKTTHLVSVLGDLQDLFKFDAIDLIDLSTSPPVLSHRIIRDGTCLFAKNQNIKIEYETQTESIYLDTAPMREEYFKHLKIRLLSKKIVSTQRKTTHVYPKPTRPRKTETAVK